MSDKIVIGTLVYREDDQGHLRTRTGEHYASIRRAAYRFMVEAHGVDDSGRVYMVAYHELPASAVMQSEPEQPELEPDWRQPPENQPEKPRRTSRQKTTSKTEEPDAAGNDGPPDL